MKLCANGTAPYIDSSSYQLPFTGPAPTDADAATDATSSEASTDSAATEAGDATPDAGSDGN